MTSGYIHFRTDGILTSRIGEMLSLATVFLVLFLSVLLGGTVGGLAAASGYHFKRLLKALRQK